ncbi:MAG: acetylglutamate kinase [Clostridia bacterium]|nr:acetylglutamate kinase [Clostridia bacterium]MBO5258064.1 acetylglutamate kinase [Clostridia bacterium]
MSIRNEDKASILIEALPYIQKYTGKTVVIKYGGNAMLSEELRDAVISDIVLLSLTGINVVLVHGGGPDMNDLLKKIGKKSEFINGLRYTDEETAEVALMVLAGKTNKQLVDKIGRTGGRAIGLCGLDGGLIKATRHTDAEGTDYGFVGDIVSINAEVIQDVIKRGYIPVISTVAHAEDAEGVYNINADTAAAEIAVALNAENLILLTDTVGVLRDPKDPETLISVIRTDEVDGLRAEGIISGGMIPKVECCVSAVNGGVKTFIIDGRIKHSILIEMLSEEGIGTMFTKG